MKSLSRKFVAGRSSIPAWPHRMGFEWNQMKGHKDRSKSVRGSECAGDHQATHCTAGMKQTAYLWSGIYRFVCTR